MRVQAYVSWWTGTQESAIPFDSEREAREYALKAWANPNVVAVTITAE